MAALNASGPSGRPKDIIVPNCRPLIGPACRCDAITLSVLALISRLTLILSSGAIPPTRQVRSSSFWLSALHDVAVRLHEGEDEIDAPPVMTSAARRLRCRRAPDHPLDIMESAMPNQIALLKPGNALEHGSQGDTQFTCGAALRIGMRRWPHLHF